MRNFWFLFQLPKKMLSLCLLLLCVTICVSDAMYVQEMNEYDGGHTSGVRTGSSTQRVKVNYVLVPYPVPVYKYKYIYVDSKSTNSLPQSTDDMDMDQSPSTGSYMWSSGQGHRRHHAANSLTNRWIRLARRYLQYYMSLDNVNAFVPPMAMSTRSYFRSPMHYKWQH